MNYLRQQVRKLGGEYVMDHFDVSIDRGWQISDAIITIWFKQDPIWRRKFYLDELNAGGIDMRDEELNKAVVDVMKEHLDLVSAMHHARLNKMFPNSIEKVLMQYDPAKDCKQICVVFKNGHRAIGPEYEAKQEIFLARCAMLYDLPPL